MIVISDDPGRFEPGSTLRHEDGRALRVASAREHRDRFLVRFEGIEDRVAASSLRGALYVDASATRALADDEFWIHDLVGLAVQLRDGTEIGSVAGVIAHPAQALLRVATPSGEALVPVVKAIVTDVDLDAGRIVIDPPEGLL